MAETFRALRAIREDGQVTVRLERITLADLSPGQVTIRARYSDVNYKDALAATGRNGIIREYPRVPGIDVAGVVEDSLDPRFSPGDEVLVTGFELGTGHDGGYAERVRVPADWVIAIPKGLTLCQAMALGTAGFTVALCVQRMEQNGQRPEMGPIAVTGIAVDVLSGLGYEVTAITGKMQDEVYLRALGARNVMDRSTIARTSQPLERGIWGGAIDNVGGEMLAWLTRTVRPWGNICSVGLAGGEALNTTVMPFILRGVALLGVTSANCPTVWRQRLWTRLANDLRPRHLDQLVRREVTLEKLPSLFDEVLRGSLTGRTIVRISED